MKTNTSIARNLVNVSAVAIGALLALFLFLGFATSAYAGIGVGVAPSFPSEVTVGDENVPVSLQFTNISTVEVGDIEITGIELLPQCGDVDTCDPDPGVFSVSSSGSGSNACTGINFSIAETDPSSGLVELLPSSDLVLAIGQTCVIEFTVDVLKVPTIDALPAVSGIQTVQRGFVHAIEEGGFLPGSGVGTDVTTVNKADPEVVTFVLDNEDVDVTNMAVLTGTEVRDTVEVTGAGPVPTGTVDFALYDNLTCDGQLLGTEAGVALDGSGEAEATPFTPGVGLYSYLVTYNGDANYNTGTALCEPFTVVDARITIGDSGTNRVNDAHTFTVLVEEHDGTGWAAASGETINSTITGVGSITGGTCGPSGPTDVSGECTVVVNSAVVGVGTVNASGNVLVAGVSIPVATNGYGAYDISNQKTWINPSISIEKATNGEDADTPTGPMILVGDPVNWTYVVTNTNGTVLTNVVVTDDKGVTVSCPKTTLAVGEEMTCTANGTAEAGQYANIGTVVGTPPVGSNVTDTDPSHYFGVAPSIDIEKATNGEDADAPTGPSIPVGDSVVWTYVVENTGNVDLSNVVVTDDKLGAINCPKTTLAVGESMTCTANGTAMAGQYSNLGTVVGTPPVGPNVTDSDPSHYYGEEMVTFCSFSQGYWFAKPNVSWGDGVDLGGHTYTRENGLDIWNIKGRNNSHEAKQAFTQYSAIMLSAQEQGLTQDDMPAELVAALKYIEGYFDGEEKLTAANIASFPKDQDLRRAAGFIGNWIDANHCPD
jgi:hypothetical protein